MKRWRSHQDKKIFEALIILGGTASAQQIADETRKDVRDLPRKLSKIPYVRYLSGEAENSQWGIIGD